MIEIARVRKEKGISQNKLAAMAGIAQATISDIESGNTPAPKISTLKKIADALNCTIDDLFPNATIRREHEIQEAEQGRRVLHQNARQGE